MKKILLLLLVCSLALVSCTDKSEENETLYESQATEKDDATNPNNGGGEDHDNSED